MELYLATSKGLQALLVIAENFFFRGAENSSFPNLGVCLSNCKCHSFPNLKSCLITSLLPQNTQSEKTA